MLTLYSYSELFGVADNNGYGLKVFAFLRLTGLPFRHEHIFDASSAPRGQLPYIVDDGERLHFGLVRSQRRLLSPSSRQGEGIGKMQELPNWSRFVDLDGMGFRQGLSPVTPSRACAFRRNQPLSSPC